MKMFRQLKIVQWNSAVCWGGAEIRLTEICVNLKERKHEILVICRKNTPLYNWAKNNGFLTYPYAPRGSANFLRAIQIGLYIRSWKANIIHAHAGRDYAPALIAGMVANCPVVIHRRLFGALNPVTVQLSNMWKDVFIGVSQKVTEELVNKNKISSRKVFTIHLGIEPRRIECTQEQIAKIKSEFDIKDQKIIVSVGHLYPSKGHDDLIRAISYLKKRNLSLIVFIIGEGSERTKLETIIKKEKLNDTVYLLGQRDDVPAFLHICNFFALLSWEDPFPGAILEAMACKKPVVGCNAGGVPEMIQDGVTGFLVPPHSPEIAAEIFYKLISDDTLAKKLGENARLDFEKRFSMKSRIDKLEEVYKYLVIPKDDNNE